MIATRRVERLGRGLGGGKGKTGGHWRLADEKLMLPAAKSSTGGVWVEERVGKERGKEGNEELAKRADRTATTGGCAARKTGGVWR